MPDADALLNPSFSGRQSQTNLDQRYDRDEYIDNAVRGNSDPAVDTGEARDVFWHQDTIDLTRWDRLYPYQLVVLRATQNERGTSYDAVPGWQFTLPLPPEAWTYGMPFAITTNITQGGVIEEHNGAPIRMINFRGTTGFLPKRGVPNRPSNLTFDVASTIAGGTVNAAREVSAGTTTLVSSALGQALQTTNVHKKEVFEVSESANDENALLAKSTGYYQFRRLKKFLEGYVALKKQRKHRDKRLAVAVWKDQAVYLVTPVTFEVTKAGDSPFEYRYNLVFKAWRRVQLEEADLNFKLERPVRRNPNKLARVLNTLRDARRVLQGVSEVGRAAIGDVDRLIFEPLRESVLMAKDALGVAITAADLPDALVHRLTDSAIRLAEDAESLERTAGVAKNKAKTRLQQLGLAANEAQPLTSTRDQTRREQVRSVHPAVKPFNSPKKHFEFMEQLDVSRMRLPVTVTRQVARERERVRSLTRKDFETRRDSVEKAAGRLAVALGAGDATYEDTYQVNVKRLKTTPTDSDWEALFAIEASVQALDALAATGDNEPSARDDAIDVMAALHRRSGTAFRRPQSKFAVPFPYGGTLEELARQHLGNPDRWPEIAALNGLREPYIDEEGFDLTLAVNGAGNQVVVPKTLSLYVGQVVFVASTGTRRARRRVVDLREVGETVVVTVDGDPTMGNYKVTDAAKLSAFLPDTLNSQQLVYIPSDQDPADEDFLTKSIPGVDEFDPMVAVGGVDLLLDSNNDLVVTPDGDTRFAAGLTNIIQNVRVALSVQRGGLMGHDDFGLPLAVGVNTAEFSAKEVLEATRRMLANDASFTRIEAIRVTKDGPAASINIAVVVAGTEKPVPIGFKVRP